MTTRIYSPEGAVGQPPVALTPAPAALAGCRIAVLDNGKPGAEVLMGHLAERLAERTGAVYAGIQRKGSAATPCEDALFETIVEDVDLVLTGTAD
jgi:hypothetical protein